VLRSTFGSETERGAGGWRKLQNKSHHNLYYPSNRPTVRMIKSRRIEWAGQVAQLEMGNCKNILFGKPGEMRSFGGPGTD
jgi:hypothetical protein